jgi:hypothetical protein
MSRWKSVFGVVFYVVLGTAIAKSFSHVSHELEWIPFSTQDYVSAAALDENGLAVVLYDPREVARLPDQLAILLLLREEQIAKIAQQMVDTGQSTRKTIWNERASKLVSSASRYAVIEEENIYGSPLLKVPDKTGLDPAARLTCLAFLLMTERDRSLALRQYQSFEDSGEQLTFGSARGKRFRELRTEMRQCASGDMSKR